VNGNTADMALAGDFEEQERVHREILASAQWRP
jgi:hypothetical protein